MSQVNQATTKNQKPYHTPQLRKFGNINELTLTLPTGNLPPADGGTLNFYSS